MKTIQILLIACCAVPIIIGCKKDSSVEAVVTADNEKYFEGEWTLDSSYALNVLISNDSVVGEEMQRPAHTIEFDSQGYVNNITIDIGAIFEYNYLPTSKELLMTKNSQTFIFRIEDSSDKHCVMASEYNQYDVVGFFGDTIGDLTITERWFMSRMD